MNAGCKVELSFTGSSELIHSALYLYVVTSAGLSATLSYAHA